MPTLAASARARLPDTAFAYVDAQGRRRLPIHDASHVRNALARFDQTTFEDDVARERARERLLTEVKLRARDIASLPRGMVTFLLTDIEGSTGLLQQLGDGYATLLRDVRALIRKSVA